MHYRKLAIALAINVVLMYLITYAMIVSFDHFYFNMNRVYMALMMAAPMAMVMLAVMRTMYQDRKRNVMILASAAIVLAGSFLLARTQVPIGNEQFLRSMIPHHSSAILMCNRSDLTDREIIDLCGRIVKAQRDEIAEMEAILARY